MPGRRSPPYSGPVSTEPDNEWSPDRVSRFGLLWRIAVAGLTGYLLWFSVVALFAEQQAPVTAATARLVMIDPLLGLVSLGIVARWRRTHPMATAIGVALISLFSISSSGASIWAAVSVATRRRPRELAILSVVIVAVSLLAPRTSPMPEVFAPGPWWFEAVFAVLATAVNLAVGYAVGSRRAVTRAWIDRARTAEAEQRARVAAAQSGERTRIAREMHDVLAHRISLVALHSGALRYRSDLPEGEREQALDIIHSNAEQALADLREVLGVLRDPTASGDGQGVEPPQPELPDVVRLVDDARAAGERVDLDDHLDDVPSTPTGRTAYRIVQEGLTNARKHAPGARVTVRLTGNPREGLTLTLTNARPVAPPATLPTSGLGLLGLTERVALAGGRLEQGVTPEGGYRLAVWLPWAP